LSLLIQKAESTK